MRRLFYMTVFWVPLLQTAAFAADAPLGTGLEWMTIAAVVLPALILIMLVYLGNDAV